MFIEELLKPTPGFRDIDIVKMQLGLQDVEVRLDLMFCMVRE